jgi:hypothetical protein
MPDIKTFDQKKRLFESELPALGGLPRPAISQVSVQRKPISPLKVSHKSPSRQTVLRLIEWFKKE